MTALLAGFTLLVAMVVLGAAATLASLAAPEEPDGTRAGAARLGNGVAIVIVTDENGASWPSVLRWGLIAVGVATIPSVASGWFVSGRLLRNVDTAFDHLELAEIDRSRRLEEVVHELRTPLAVMGTNLELAAMRANPTNVDVIAAARRAVHRMTRTVDDLSGHGRLAVQRGDRPEDLGREAQEITSEHAGPAADRGLHLRVAGTDPVMVPAVDRAAVRTTIGNFLANAIRLAPRGSVVTVDWGTFERWAWVAVTDEGPGLAPGLHARVFERGWQGRHDRDRPGLHAGRGLGLTIARQLTEAQNGVVTLESDEGAGSSFALWLPTDDSADDGQIVADDRIHPLVSPWRRRHLPLPTL